MVKYYVYVFGERDEEIKIGKFASKDDVVTALSEFLDFFEKNMDQKRLDIVILAREEVE